MGQGWYVDYFSRMGKGNMTFVVVRHPAGNSFVVNELDAPELLRLLNGG